MKQQALLFGKAVIVSEDAPLPTVTLYQQWTINYYMQTWTLTFDAAI